MTTKGVIGCNFGDDSGVLGMYMHSDGFAEDIMNTILWNMRHNEWTLERTMRVIYEEPLFYFGFVHRDFSLPRCYFDFPLPEDITRFGHKLHRFERTVKLDTDFTRLAQDMSEEAKYRVAKWMVDYSRYGYATLFQMLINAAPEGAGSSAEFCNDMAAIKRRNDRTKLLYEHFGRGAEYIEPEFEPYKPEDDYRTKINESGKQPSGYTFYVDVPDNKFYWHSYEKARVRFDGHDVNECLEKFKEEE